MSAGGSKSQVVGYWYHMDLLATFCYGPVDEIVEIRAGERTAWTGSASSGSISINQASLFGGEEREGGLIGGITLMPGDDSQTAPTVLTDSVSKAGITVPTPGYRGVFSLFFTGFNTGTPGEREGFAFSAINPYYKPVEVRVRRYSTWYPAKARIGNDANPAHIIHEVLTNVEWGGGYPEADLDLTRFQAVADTLYDEGFGLSLQWSQSSSIEDFIDSVLEVINGAINEDRTTGKVFISLIRDDYVVGDLFTFDPDNCVLESFTRAGAGDIVNEITLEFTKPEDFSTDSITIQDLASIQNQGRVVNQKIEYVGITGPDLAARVAQRELQSRSRGLAKATIRSDRSAYEVYPGDACKLDWPELGISNLVFRVVDVNVGELDSSELVFELIEDVFGLPAASYVATPGSGWVDNSSTAQPVQDQRAIELPYFEVFTATTHADRDEYPQDFGLGVLLAKRPQTVSQNYIMKTSPDNSTFSGDGVGNWTPYCTLAADLNLTETTLTISGKTDFEFVDQYDLVVIGNELMEIESVTATTLVVRRAVLDSLPQTHTSGDDIFILTDSLVGIDNEARVDGETAYYRALTKVASDTLAVSSAPTASVTMDNRFLRPYPPGNVQLDGQLFPASLATDGDVTLSWSHRDRLQQTARPLLAWTAGNVGPEPGTTYNVRVYNSVNTEIETYTGVTSNTLVILDTVGDTVVHSGQHRVEIESVRDGWASRTFSHTFILT